MSILLLLAILCSSVKNVFVVGNERPIIGIVAQELDPSLKELYPAYSCFIAASYIKAVESSGARVVPIVINKSELYYRNLLSSVNGVVLPGGSSIIGHGNPYYDTVTRIYKIATEMNKKNISFPIFGVCLGFEFLITVANNHESFLKRCDVNCENLPLEFTRPYSQTTLFADVEEKILHILNSSDATFNYHTWCALGRDFNDSSLIDDWLITSFSTSLRGLEFIASVEHKSLPYFGLQFHPEKIAFEWNPKNKYPHFREALVANRYFYDTLINFAKKNANKFKSQLKETRSLIYNYPAVVGGTLYEQIYLF